MFQMQSLILLLIISHVTSVDRDIIGYVGFVVLYKLWEAVELFLMFLICSN